MSHQFPVCCCASTASNKVVTTDAYRDGGSRIAFLYPCVILFLNGSSEICFLMLPSAVGSYNFVVEEREVARWFTSFIFCIAGEGGVVAQIPSWGKDAAVDQG